MKCTLKKVRGTDKIHSHTLVLVDGKEVGYYMQNTNPASAKGENWNFVSKVNHLESFHETTEKKLLEVLNKQLNGEQVTIKQSFGRTMSLNPGKS